MGFAGDVLYVWLVRNRDRIGFFTMGAAVMAGIAALVTWCGK